MKLNIQCRSLVYRHCLQEGDDIAEIFRHLLLGNHNQDRHGQRAVPETEALRKMKWSVDKNCRERESCRHVYSNIQLDNSSKFQNNFLTDSWKSDNRLHNRECHYSSGFAHNVNKFDIRPERIRTPLSRINHRKNAEKEPLPCRSMCDHC